MKHFCKDCSTDFSLYKLIAYRLKSVLQVYRLRSVLHWLAFGILFLLIARSGVDSYFTGGDESGYFLNLELIDQYGISTEFLRHFSGMAGPLHPILHWLLRPLTGGIPPAARFVNFVILGYFIWHFRKDVGERILFIPMTFICAGYAMTEFPALLFLLFSILIINNLDSIKFNKISLFFLAGFCLSLAIAGRWNYLILLPIFWLWLFFKEVKTVSILLFISSSLLFPIWIIYAWGGLVPPEARVVSGYTTFDIVPQHLILSGCFSALMLLMLRPSWLFEMKKSISVFTYLSICVFISNSLLGLYNFLPAKSVFNRAFPLWGIKGEEMFASAFGSLSICLSLVFFYNLFLHTWKRKSDWNYVFYAFCVVAILLTSIKTTHIFSSRYPYQALPFLLLILQYEAKNETKWWEIALAISGIGWGVVTWFSYQTIY